LGCGKVIINHRPLELESPSANGDSQPLTNC
jgi:hypothetical protein